MGNFDGWTSDAIAKKAGRKAPTPLQRMQALGRLPAGKMNKTEAAYANLLEAKKHTGEVLWYAFEPVNIRIGPNCYYRADFLVMPSSMALEVHEVKGYWTDDALVKFKAASTILPVFKFKAVRMERGAFETIQEL